MRTNNILSSNSLETEGDLPHGKMSKIFMERPMCLPPKADKNRLWSSLPSDEVSLPLSKRRHWDQEAMSACVAEAATALVELEATSVTGQDDAYKISAYENYYAKCFDNDKNSIKGNEECVKVDTLIQKEATEIGGSIWAQLC